MAPVIIRLRESQLLEPFVLATGQHTEMLSQALDFFGINPDKDLAIMRKNQSLDYVTSSVIEKVGHVLDDLRPFFVLVHGDTTTTMAASLAAFYRRVRLGHVEAGLRSGNTAQPFPEELNRIIADRAAGWWFPPTEGAAGNLISEGCDPARVIQTGNTVIDALLYASGKVGVSGNPSFKSIPASARMLLLTAHRRESWGEPLRSICDAVKKILSEFPDLWAVVPMHRNPKVRDSLGKILGNEDRVILCDALDYPDFIWAMKRSDIILTDSGGVQEETTVLGKPTLVLREVTERPEAIEFGTSRLVGTNEQVIVETAREALEKGIQGFSAERVRRDPPFGEGKASGIIVETIENLSVKD